MTSFGRSILGIVFILVIAFCLSFAVSKGTERWGGIDLTEDSLYTLSDGSKQIVASLPRPLTVTLFYSKKAADNTGSDFFTRFHNYYYYVRDLLRAYARHSGGKLTLLEYDPEAFSDAEQEAERLGITAHPLTESSRFYFGIAVTSGGGAKEIIPSLVDTRPSEQAQLEYRISELIDLASRRKKTRVGLLSSIQVNGEDLSPYMRQMMQMQGQQIPEAWLTVDQLKRFYEVQDVAADVASIDPTLDYLLVVHPKELSEKTLYAIDQFVMRGGKLMAFVDPNCLLADEPPQQQNNPFGGAQHDKSSNLNRLTKNWGVELEGKQFAGDLRYGARVPLRNGRVVRFVGKMDFDGEALAASQIVTNGLDTVTMFLPGVLRTTEVEGVEVTPLIRTSPTGNTWTASSFELGGPMGMDLERLSQKFEPGAEELTVAAMISGKLKSAFPDGAPKADAAEDGDGSDGEADVADEGPKPAEAHIAESSVSNTVIVVADVDMLTDSAAFQRSLFGYTMANSNVAFLMNSLDFLAGSDALISIRARKQFTRPFGLIDEIERKADEQTREQVAKINEQIEQFDSELSELRKTATAENVGVKQSQAYEKERVLNQKKREATNELRAVQKAKLDEIQSIGDRIKVANIFGVPALVAAIGVALFFVRRSRRQRAEAEGARS
ncbi:MAG: Gldg family protein [Planctomycetes bacterium]|nr:Gldg family protein [Planctomycetota bacterium]